MFSETHGNGKVLPETSFSPMQGERASPRINGKAHLIPVALGAITSLGGVFLVLAAHQVLPHGLIAVSDLGIWGQALGYSAVGVGLLIAGIGGVRGYLSYRPHAKIVHSEDIEASIEPTGKEEASKVDFKGTVYIHSCSSGPVRNDCRFKFSERLRTKDHEPISIKEDDIYLELVIQPREDSIFTDTYGYSTSFTYLPNSLFAGIKENETVQFYYDNKFIELSCKQADCAFSRSVDTFEAALKTVKESVLHAKSEAYWLEDIAAEPKFMQQCIGQSLSYLNPTGEVDREIKDFSFYEKDQEANGPYKELDAKLFGTNFVFNIHRDRVDLSEINLIESELFRGLRRIWVLIPHKPEKNQLSGVRLESSRYSDGKVRNYNIDAFQPKKGERLGFYHHGQYFIHEMNGNEKASLSFNEAGWLQLSIKA